MNLQIELFNVVRSLRWVGLMGAVCLVGCAEPDEGDAESSALSGSAQALDNDTSDPNDGKVCYVDGPLAGQGKGKMEGGFCCVARKEGETCYLCTDAYECQIGNAEPACLTIDPNRGDGTTVVKPGITAGAAKATTSNAASLK